MNDNNNSPPRTEEASDERPNRWAVLEAFGPEPVIELREGQQQPWIAPEFSDRTEQDQVYTYLLAQWAASELADDPTERWVDRRTLTETCSSTTMEWIERDERIRCRGNQVTVKENAINDVADHLVNTYGEWLDEALSR